MKKNIDIKEEILLKHITGYRNSITRANALAAMEEYGSLRFRMTLDALGIDANTYMKRVMKKDAAKKKGRKKERFVQLEIPF